MKRSFKLERTGPAGETLYSIVAGVENNNWTEIVGWYDVIRAEELRAQLPVTTSNDVVRSSVVVREDHRGRGIASRLAEELITSYEEQGLTAIIGMEPAGSVLEHKFLAAGFTPFTPKKPEELPDKYHHVKKWLFRNYETAPSKVD